MTVMVTGMMMPANDVEFMRLASRTHTCYANVIVRRMQMAKRRRGCRTVLSATLKKRKRYKSLRAN